MKQVLCFILIGILAGFCGCGGSDKRRKEKPVDPNSIPGQPIVIEGGGEFPAFLAGTWVEEGLLKRTFYISQKGNLDMMILGIGHAPVKPLARVEIPLIEGGKGTFTSGKWQASYEPQTRELALEIVIDSFSMKMPTQSLEGSLREIYIGKISEDGKRWEVNYQGYPLFIVNTETLKNHILHSPEEVVEETVVFTKYEEPQTGK